MKIPSSRHLARRLGVLLLPLALLLTSLGAKAQIIRDAVSWSHSVEDKSPTEKVIVFSATIKGDWHLYGTDLPSGGPTPTSLIVDKIAGAQLVGKLTASKKPIEKHDPNFDMMLRFYSGQVSFRQTLRITDPKAFAFSGAIRYMVCNDEQCLPPTNWDFTITLKELGKVAAAPAAEQTEAKAEVAPSAEAAQPLTADSVQQAADSAAVALAEPSDAASALWTPVISELKAYGDRALSGADSGLLMLFFAGFVGGLVALVTPCVWPMIPMTVSFFLKRSKDRKKGIRDAAIYGLAIIVIYLALGLSVSALFGADALNNLATNAYFNIFFFLLLVVFAASFFGAFEIVLPASWTTKMDQKGWMKLA